MYSVVLMMALSGNAQATDFGHRACSGCNGSCSGYVACSGCHGRARRSRGCSGCTGAPVCPPACCGGRRGGLFHRNRGCNGCSGCHGVVYSGCTGGYVGCTGGHPTGEPQMAPKTEKIPTPPKKTKASATIIVTLPASALLTVDGNATRSTSARRTFISPVLESGADYYYTFRAELSQDGTVRTQTRQVTVRGGETTSVPFSFSGQTIARR